MPGTTPLTTTEPSPDGYREFTFTDRDFDRIRERLAGYAGIALSDVKQDMVYNRLVRRLRQQQLHSVDQYLLLLDDPIRGPEEFGHFINSMTTNHTAFFREPHHFDYLKQSLLPSMTDNRREPLRIWSAGCSVGEEPYSIAITLDQQMDRGQSARILATDIDTQVLDIARDGIYQSERISKLAPELRKQAFLRGKGRQQGMVRVKARIRSMVTFRKLNLNGPWPMTRPFDVIFCRNVMIYFDRATQQQLQTRLAGMLNPGGWLFIGHSESLHSVDDQFIAVGQTVYQKRL